jgi:hypothetical protein
MFAQAVSHPRLPVRLASRLGAGFVFWAVFLLVLLSGNAARSAAAGTPLAFGDEALRILSASALASFSALLLVPLSARYPFQGPRWALHVAILLAASGLVAICLVVIAWAGAPLVLSPDNSRLTAPLSVQLAADAPLLTFAMLGFVLLLQFRSSAPAPLAGSPQTEGFAFTVRARHGVFRIAAEQIDWFESQENYVALHCGPETHLVRETLAAVEGRLDPAAFLRIHRRKIVNLRQLRGLRPLPGGDAIALLDGGVELRVSRTYANAVRVAHLRG